MTPFNVIRHFNELHFQQRQQIKAIVFFYL